MLQSILIGILPCREEFWPIIREKASEEEDELIRWRSFAEIEDEGIATLVVSAVSDADPNSVIKLLHRELVTAFPEENIETEMWATAPAPIDLKPKDGFQLCKDNKDEKEWQDWTSHTLKEFGIILQQGILSQDQVHEIRSLVEQAIDEVENLLRTYRPEIEIGKDSFLFKEIASRNLQRFDLRLDSIASDFVTKCVMENPIVKSILTRSLGNYDDIDFDVSAVYSKPGACIQGWHADGDHQKGGKFAGWSNDGWKNVSDPFAICLFIPLIDLNESVGFTQFWPKSHWTKDLAGFGPIAVLTNTTFDAMGKAGDAIFYDYRLMHRGMPNNSESMRPVLQVVVKKKWYVEEANYGDFSLKAEVI